MSIADAMNQDLKLPFQLQIGLKYLYNPKVKKIFDI
jgi:hypothetical protein